MPYFKCSDTYKPTALRGFFSGFCFVSIFKYSKEWPINPCTPSPSPLTHTQHLVKCANRSDVNVYMFHRHLVYVHLLLCYTGKSFSITSMRMFFALFPVILIDSVALLRNNSNICCFDPRAGLL